MEVNKETIELYIEEAKTKIELIKVDMQAYRYRIEKAEQEIYTLNFFIGQYEKALETLLNKEKK